VRIPETCQSDSHSEHSPFVRATLFIVLVIIVIAAIVSVGALCSVQFVLK
jgi:hypothetical protein